MIIVTRGLPASGKSTWAKAWVAADPSSRLRVNRDDIRQMLYGKYWGEGVDEAQVTKTEEALVTVAIKAGRDVVVDATHLKASYAAKWYKFGAPVEFKDFPVPIADLTDRDIHRGERGERSVGTEVIRGLAARFHIPADGTLPMYPRNTGALPGFAPYVPGRIKAYSFDIDGTLAQMVDRGPYDTSKYDTDVPHHQVVELLWDLQASQYDDAGGYTKIAFLGISGRSEEFHDVTRQWLKTWGIQLDALFMRPAGDLRNDAIVKSDLVDKHISNMYDVVMHFDDRNRVVDALRAKGMKVAQVAEGNF